MEIRGVNGSVRAVASDDGLAHVDAAWRVHQSDPQRVDIKVVERYTGVTICAVHPRLSDASDLDDCEPGDVRDRFRCWRTRRS